MHKINRLSFIDILSRVEPGLSLKDFIEQSNCFLFEDGWCITYNDEITCRARTNLPESFRGAAYALPLKKTLEHMQEDEVEISFTETELLVKERRRKVGVRIQTDIRNYADLVDPPETWMPVTEEFIEAVKQILPTAGTDDEKFITVCVHIHPQWMETTDQSQVTRYRIEAGNDESILVRAKSLKHILALGLVKWGVTKEWIHFKNKSLIFSCRRQIGEFPDLEHAFRIEGEKANLPKGAVDSAKLSSIFSGDDELNDRVKVSLFKEKGEMSISSQGQKGWSSSAVDLVYEGGNAEFLIDPANLIRIIETHNECVVGEHMLWVEGENWQYATCLGSVGDGAKRPDSDPEEKGDDDG